MKEWQTDVLVIGSGLAGIRAAIEARRSGRAVLVVSRASIGKANNTAISKGFFAVPGVSDPGDGAGRHLDDIIKGGGRIGDPALVSVMVSNLEGEVGFLAECGVPLALRSDGSPVYNRVPGHSFPRVLGTARSSGVDLLSPLVARAGEMGIWMEQGITVLSLVNDGERVYGVLGCTRQGEPVAIRAAAVVLATGGAGGLYLFTNNAPGSVGMGQAIALEAGLPLVDMEFVQFYPTYLHEPGRPRVMVSYEILVAAAGAVLRNSRGEDIREIHGLKEGTDLTRDRLSRAIASEIRAGRGVGPEGVAVALDLTTMARPEKYRRFLPRAVPPDLKQVNVAPLAHFTMGGIAVKPGGETGIAGLWAIGEVAGGIHGANRIGGNALAECLALGRKAGSAASEYSSRAGRRELPLKDNEILSCLGVKGEDLSSIEDALRKVLNSQAGILRDAGGLEECLAQIKGLEGALSGKKSAAAVKPGMMLDVARAICLPALARRESRGSHYRLDFPGEREEYLGNFMVRKVEGNLELEFVPR